MDFTLLDKSPTVTPLIVRLYDSHRIYTLARDEKPEAKHELTSAVCELLEMHLSPREHELVADVLISLMKQAETDLRAALAERLAALDDVPLRLVLHFSNDDIEVARPILKHSNVLSDLDLIYIIKSKTAQYWQAIAQRRRLSDYVVNTLADTGDVDTAIRLAENKALVLDEAALVKLSDMAQGCEALATPLLRREEISADLAAGLYEYVGETLKSYIRSNFGANETIEAAMGEAIESLTQSGSFNDVAAPSLEVIGAAKLLHKKGELNVKEMIGVLRRGEYATFLAQFACYNDVTIEDCEILLAQGSGQGLAVLCQASKIGKPDFLSIFLLCRKFRGDVSQLDMKVVGRAVEYYCRITPDMAKAILGGDIARNIKSTDIH